MEKVVYLNLEAVHVSECGSFCRMDCKGMQQLKNGFGSYYWNCGIFHKPLSIVSGCGYVSRLNICKQREVKEESE